MYWIDCCVTLRIRDSETKLKRWIFSLNSIWLSPVGNPGDPARFDCALCTVLVSMEAVFRECLPSLMTFRFAFPFSSSRRIPQARGLETVMAAFCADDGVGPSLCRMLPSLCLRRAELFVQEGKSFAPPFVSMDALSKPLESHQIDAHFTKMVPHLYRKRKRDRREGRIIHFTFFSPFHSLFLFILYKIVGGREGGGDLKCWSKENCFIHFYFLHIDWRLTVALSWFLNSLFCRFLKNSNCEFSNRK